MSNEWGHAGHAAKHIGEKLAKMRPLAKRKSPAVAFVAGLLFQGLGVGLYLGSWKDFFVCVGVFTLFFGVLLPTVVGEAWLFPAAALFCAVYGAWRANDSNEKLEGRSRH